MEKCRGRRGLARAAVHFEHPFVGARFVRRLNRFLAEVELEGQCERVHVRNSGRLRELLTAGRRVWLDLGTSIGRATRFTLALVRTSAGYVSMEVKSVTLVRDGVAFFPDAPTARGSSHLELLSKACVGGRQAAVMFVVQRGDAVRFTPNLATDPAFAVALARAAAAGVRVLAYRCRVSSKGVWLERRIPVELSATCGGACGA